MAKRNKKVVETANAGKNAEKQEHSKLLERMYNIAVTLETFLQVTVKS